MGSTIPYRSGQRFQPAVTPHGSIPEFGQRANRVTVRQFDLSVERNESQVDMTGTFLWAVDASDLDAKLDIQLNSQNGQPIGLSQGMVIGGTPFSGLYLSNNAQPGKWIRILYTVENPPGDFRIENPQIALQNVTLSRSNAIAGSGPQTAPGSILANAARRELVIQTDHGNSVPLELTDMSGFKFAELLPGASMTIATTAGVQVSGGAGEHFTYLEVLD